MITSFFTKKNRQRGFSILELLVTVAIFVFISTLILFRYRAFNRQLELDNLAHETALWVRQTQVSAMSVRRFGVGTGIDSFSSFSGYGMHFDRSYPGQFVFFSDRYSNPNTEGDKRYGSGEAEQTITFPKGVTIEKLCGNTSPVMYYDGCSESGADTFDIVFTRPEPDADITGVHGSTAQAFSYAEIVLRSEWGYVRTVRVWSTGQVIIN